MASITIGVIMLNTRFPRLPGDIGNPDSFECPVIYKTVGSARVDSVVTGQNVDPHLAQDILSAAKSLQARNAQIILTSCGFLGNLQGELEAVVSVPVISSALIQIQQLRQSLGPDAKIGVLTFDSGKLSPHHFAGHFDDNIVIEGIETGVELHRVIANDLPDLDMELAETDAIAATRRLMSRQPEIQSIVLECTNLSPYRDAIKKTANVPVADIISATFAAIG